VQLLLRGQCRTQRMRPSPAFDPDRNQGFLRQSARHACALGAYRSFWAGLSLVARRLSARSGRRHPDPRSEQGRPALCRRDQPRARRPVHTSSWRRPCSPCWDTAGGIRLSHLEPRRGSRRRRGTSPKRRPNGPGCRPANPTVTDGGGKPASARAPPQPPASVSEWLCCLAA